MKFKLDYTAIILGIVVVLMLFFLYQWKCNVPKAPPAGKQQNDSLKEVINRVQFASTERLNAITRDNDSLIDENVTIQMRNSDLIGALESSKKRIKELQVKIKSPDSTTFMDPACANLSDEFDKYVALSDQKEKGQDSIIQNQQIVITNKDSAIAERDKLNTSTSQAFFMASKNYDDLNKAYNKQAKEIKWQKTKTRAMAAVIVAGAIKIILDASKK